MEEQKKMTSITYLKITCIHIPRKRLILIDNCPQNHMKKKKKKTKTTTTTTKYVLQINAKCMFFPNDLLGNPFYVDHRLTQFPKSKPIHHNIKI